MSNGGNIRRFIQLCSLLFTMAAPREHVIDREFARNALSRQVDPVPDKDTLRQQLTDLLLSAHVDYQADYTPADGPGCDFAVGDAADGFRAFIVVTDALISGRRELTVASRTLDLVQHARCCPSRPRWCWSSAATCRRS